MATTVDAARWVDLSGSELVARLTNRGMPLAQARRLVRFREHPGPRRTITEWLAR